MRGRLPERWWIATVRWDGECVENVRWISVLLCDCVGCLGVGSFVLLDGLHVRGLVAGRIPHYRWNYLDVDQLSPQNDYWWTPHKSGPCWKSEKVTSLCKLAIWKVLYLETWPSQIMNERMTIQPSHIITLMWHLRPNYDKSSSNYIHYISNRCNPNNPLQTCHNSYSHLIHHFQGEMDGW